MGEVYAKPAPVPEAPSADSDLAGAIRELAEAIRAEREERLLWERGVLESLLALVQSAAPRDDLGPEPPVGAAN